jgi:hypothetical protein
MLPSFCPTVMKMPSHETLMELVELRKLSAMTGLFSATRCWRFESIKGAHVGNRNNIPEVAQILLCFICNSVMGN